MRALTLTQPWAGLVASGIKLVENRPRRMIKREDFGKQFAIHASRDIDEEVYGRIVEIAPELAGFLESSRGGHRWYQLSQVKSAVIAVATIDYEIEADPTHGYVGPVDVPALGDQRRWFFGPIGYVLRDIRALAKRVPCRGWQGFWTLPADVELRVRVQLAERR
jgi:hypothetical protein